MKTPDTITLTMAQLVLRQRLRLSLLAGATVLLAACSSAAKPPFAELQAAERVIANAERAQVIRYTSVELDVARTELTAARQAVLAGKMPEAQRLAMQAELSAELALVRAELVKAQSINQDMQKSIDALRQEAQRNVTGVKP